MGKLDINKYATEADKKIIEFTTRKIKGKEEEEKDNKPSQADLLVTIGKDRSELFHDETGDTFARLLIDAHYEVWPTSSKQYKRWLVHQFYESTGKAPGNETVKQALNVLEAFALFQGRRIKLGLRVTKRDDAIWYDLADEQWRAVKIEPGDWIIEQNPPILFRRYKNTAPQVLPQEGGALDLLKKYINLKNDSDWILLKAALIAAFVPEAPHVILVFFGDKGSAKTTAQRVLRKLIDPAIRDTMTLPTDKNELALMLMTNYTPCYDNLDGLKPWQSDMLCQAATGGGISKRELYSDTNEVIVSYFRCPLLNGINNVVTRDDLLDRSALFQLERIDPLERKEEAVFWQEFERDRPLILGAIFNTLAEAMMIHPLLELKWLPRMADFARWGYAISEATGGGGEAFLDAYQRNIYGAVEEAIQADPVAAAVMEFMNTHECWDGTLTELLEELQEIPGVDSKAKNWPKRPHTLSRRINKMRSALADVGIKTEPYRKNDGRYLSISKVARGAAQQSLASLNNDQTSNQSDSDEFEASPVFEKASPEKTIHDGFSSAGDASAADKSKPTDDKGEEMLGYDELSPSEQRIVDEYDL